MKNHFFLTFFDFLKIKEIIGKNEKKSLFFTFFHQKIIIFVTFCDFKKTQKNTKKVTFFRKK